MSGIVVDDNGKPVDRIVVMLKEGTIDPTVGPTAQSRTDATGRFHITAAAAGQYYVAVRVPMPLLLKMKQAIDVRVADADVTDLRIVLVPRP